MNAAQKVEQVAACIVQAAPFTAIPIASSSNSSPRSISPSLTVSGDRVYFSAEDAGGRELWSSDGTHDGTQRVIDLEPGLTNSSPTSIVALAGGVMFVAATAETGAEPWFSDGTAAGTRLVLDVTPGLVGSAASGLTDQ